MRLPASPKHLDKIAAAEYRRMGKLLVSTGIMTEIDAVGLAGYCVAYSNWILAREKIEEFGLVILSPKEKFPIQSPYLAIANKAWDQMAKMLSEFGALPASRTRVQVTDQPGALDPMAEMLGLR